MNNILGPETITLKSPAQSYVASSTLTFLPPASTRGPNGGRLVIDAIDIITKVTDYNVATTAIQGPDMWRWIKRTILSQIDGRQRYNVRGDALRQFNYLHAGSAQEYADSGTTNDQTGTFAFRVWVAKPETRDGYDFSLPVDLCRELTVECADPAELGVSAGTVTIDAATYYVLWHCHEEFSVVLHAEDEVKDSLTLPATTGGTLQIGGGRIHELGLYARGASGGASLANLTDVIVDGLMPQILLRTPDLDEPWMTAKNAHKNLNTTDGTQVRNDPVGTGKLCPIRYSTRRTSCYDGPILQSADIRLTNSVSSLVVLARIVYPKSQANIRAVMEKFALGPKDFRVKTAGKSKRNRAAWADENAAFMPMSAELPPRAAR